MEAILVSVIHLIPQMASIRFVYWMAGGKKKSGEQYRKTEGGKFVQLD